MALFVIQQRAAGSFEDPTVGWEDVATIDAVSVSVAIHAYCRQMGWFFSLEFEHDQVTVPGVGRYRAVPAQARLFMIQRQAPMGPHDRHITWEDVATIDAADAESAGRLYCEHMQWEEVAVRGELFRPYGLGMFRAVPAELADEQRITPAP